MRQRHGAHKRQGRRATCTHAASRWLPQQQPQRPEPLTSSGGLSARSLQAVTGRHGATAALASPDEAAEHGTAATAVTVEQPASSQQEGLGGVAGLEPLASSGDQGLTAPRYTPEASQQTVDNQAHLPARGGSLSPQRLAAPPCHPAAPGGRAGTALASWQLCTACRLPALSQETACARKHSWQRTVNPLAQQPLHHTHLVDEHSLPRPLVQDLSKQWGKARLGK